MLDQRRVAAQPDEKREQLFTERYESLLAWAMRLTDQQRDAAEDLVQDAFVQFVLGRTQLEEIENIDGYLRRMLRYMHISRLSRSAQHLHEAALSVADYDSCQLGWTAIEPSRRMQAFEELHQICTYACARKESSRAGSVLILRFFHDYFPTEIASILNSSRHCVDQWQRLARREVKLFLEEPRRLRFVNGTGRSDTHQVRYLKSDCDLMPELRQMIFNSRRGECLSTRELEEFYDRGNADALTTAKLAHIVSCGACLDVVNSLLGLPLLAQRYQARPPEPKEPPSDAGSGGASGGGSGDLTRKFARRLRETYEHKPQELRIAINGFLVSSLKVSSDLSELDLNLTPDDPIEFIEVCSEQGVQMLFFRVDPAKIQNEQWAWIEFSEGRSLEACFRIEDGPSLHLVYKDPVPEEAYVTGVSPNNALSSPLVVVTAGQWEEAKSGKQGVVFRLCSRLKGLVSKLRTPSDRSSVAEETTREAQLLRIFSQSAATERKRLWQRPGWLIALISAVVIAGFLYFESSLTRNVTATDLLQRASVADNNTNEHTVRHRFVNLEERRSAEGAIVAQHKIEIWENRGSGAVAQRLFDQSSRLIGGTWQKAGGARVVYHHGSKPQSQPAVATPDDLLLNLDDIWQLQPSAQSFALLIEQPAFAELEERSATYVLNYEKGRTIGASQLLKATLTLSKADLHPIEQTLLVLRGGTLREFRFVEAGFELVPSKDVAPTVFDIEPELTGGAGEPGRPGDWAFRDLTASRVPPSPSTSTPPVASAELEVDVAYLLNRAKADRNEQVNLTRSAGGSLRVEGVVDTKERKDEFLRALAPVINNPAVKIQIRTVAEATRPVSSAGAVIVQDVEKIADTVAAYEDLRAYFEKRNPSGPTDEAIRNFSSRMVNRSYKALFHVIELKKLVNRFAGVDMRAVAPDARAKWLAMIHEQADGFVRETTLLRQELQAVFFANADLAVAENTSIANDAELLRSIERLHKLTLANNVAIRSAFTISAQSSATEIKSVEFWQSLQRAQNLAVGIRQYQTSN
jgi:RNA polymerase sigma factor (sigma-70 family)